MADFATTISSSTSTCITGISSTDCEFLITFDAILSPILLILIVVGVVANSTLLFVTVAHRDMYTFANLFSADLFLSNLIYLLVIGVTDVVYYIEIAVGTTASSLLPSSVYLYLSLVITNNSCAMLTALSIERYLKIIVDRKKAAKFQTFKVAAGSCLTVWIVSLIICAPVFYGTYSDTTSTFTSWEYRIAVIVSFIGSYVIPLIIIVVIYFCIRHKLRRQGRPFKIQKREATSTRSATVSVGEEDEHDNDLRILKAVVFIVVVFTLNFGCLYITSIVLTVLPLDQVTTEIVSQLSEAVAILTAGLTPIIYGMTHPSYNPYIRRIVLCQSGCCPDGGCGACCCCCCCCCDAYNDDGECYIMNECRRCCEDDKPTSLRSVVRKASSMGGTVNASDEFVLVQKSDYEHTKNPFTI